MGDQEYAERPVRGDDGVDLDKKRRDEEKWLGSEYILEVGANKTYFQ